MPPRKRLLIGAPVLRREWIIDRYLRHVLAAVAKTEEEIDFAFLFVGGETDPTFDVIKEVLSEAKVDSYVSYIEEPLADDVRHWDTVRYERMVLIRNHLLAQVRAMAPDYFLSLDSDILLHPDALQNLLETSSRFDAVGGRCYMSRSGNTHPSNGFIGYQRGFYREDTQFVLEVEIIMAIKLMNARAYAVDYEVDRRGEDIGWSMACKRVGVSIGYDGRVCSKHVMERAHLDKVDERCNY